MNFRTILEVTDSGVDFYNYDGLVNRLVHAAKEQSSKAKKIVFLLGSPVSAPISKGQPGVTDVAGIIEDIKNVVSNDNDAKNALDKELSGSITNAYQKAFRFLLGWRSQDTVNELIRVAVLHAHSDHKTVIQKLKSANDQDALLEKLEKDANKWFIPECLHSLSSLTINFPEIFGQVQLTTNFDPLLTLAIKSNNGECYRSVLSGDGSLAQVQGNGCHIVHLHGYWRGVDTLHTPGQLNQPRPKLKAALAALLKNSIVVPIAYSGWDDVFTKTLIDILNEGGNSHDILWTYYSDNEQEILAQNSDQITSFTPGLNSGRLKLYKGVNCHDLFKDLAEKLILNKTEEPDNDGNRRDESEEPQIIQNDQEFIDKVRNEVKQILDSSDQAAAALRRALLEKQPSELPVEIILIPDVMPLYPVDITRAWLNKLSACLKNSPAKSKLRDEIKAIAKEIMGWMLLLFVDSQQFQLYSDGMNTKTQIFVPVKTQTGALVFLARLQGVGAKLKQKSRDRVTGEEHIEFNDNFEGGVSLDDRLVELQKNIYSVVFEAEPNMNDAWLDKLKSYLAEKAKTFNKMYYLTLKNNHYWEHHALIETLTTSLRYLRLLINDPNAGGISIFILDEIQLETLVLLFLNTLNDYK